MTLTRKPPGRNSLKQGHYTFFAAGRHGSPTAKSAEVYENEPRQLFAFFMDESNSLVHACNKLADYPVEKKVSGK